MTVMHAVVDIGNTAIKVAAVLDGVLQELLTFSPDMLPSLASKPPLFAASTVVIGCSGNPAMATSLAAQVFAHGGEAIILDRDAILPFKSHYARGQAGIDRLANVAAAIEKTGGGPAIVIDAGSAITVEMIRRGGIFEGGIIMPGFRLQAQSLNVGTASLPAVHLSSENPLFAGTHRNRMHIGAEVEREETERESAPRSSDAIISQNPVVFPPVNTTAAISTGIHVACLGGIEKVVREYLHADGMDQAPIIVTGGDGARIPEELDLGTCIHCPRPAEYIPTLTLQGLLLIANSQ